MSFKAINERLASRITSVVSTMPCAYIFGVLAIVALPQAIHDSFTAAGFAPLALVTWLSQSFLQLVLLSIIMVGQDIQGRITEARDIEDHNAIMESVADLRHILTEEDAEITDIAAIKADIQAIKKALNIV